MNQMIDVKRGPAEPAPDRTDDWLRAPDLVSPRILSSAIITGSTLIVLLGYLREWLRLGLGLSGTSMISLNREQNIGAWYSSLLLAACAFLLFTAGRRAVRLGRPLARYWYFVALVFVALSIDEACSVHEMLMDPIQNALHTDSVFTYAWVIPALVLVPVFAAASIPFLLSLPKRYALWFLASGAVFVSGALGFEMLEGTTDGAGPTFVLMYLVEETLEIAGTSSFLIALVSYLAEDALIELGR